MNSLEDFSYLRHRILLPFISFGIISEFISQNSF